jgi:hypothetical protein
MVLNFVLLSPGKILALLQVGVVSCFVRLLKVLKCVREEAWPTQTQNPLAANADGFVPVAAFRGSSALAKDMQSI